MYDSVVLGNTKFVQNKVFEYVLNNCDRLQLLKMPSDYNGLSGELNNIENVYFEDVELKNFLVMLKNSIINCTSGESWGMCGNIYNFKIDKTQIEKYLKFLDIEIGILINADFYEVANLSTNADFSIWLENPTFFKNDVEVLTCCSHEGYIHIEENFKKELIKVYKNAVECDPLFIKVKSFTENIDISEEDILVLSYIASYIDKENNAFAYATPRVECTFEKFKQIANRCVPNNLIQFLNYVNSFKQINKQDILNEYHQYVGYLSLAQSDF